MLLLDTHAFVWLASDLKMLSSTAKEKIKKNGDQLFVSSISALEITLLEKRQKLTLPCVSENFFARALAQHGIRDLPVNWKIAHISAKLPEIHNDPFDRIILASAQVHKMAILSKDKTMRKYSNTNIFW